VRRERVIHGERKEEEGGNNRGGKGEKGERQSRERREMRGRVRGESGGK
jgi:hypothetical protein